MNFKFAATPNIHFGSGKIKSLPNLILDYGKKAILVTGKNSFLKTHIAIELFQDLEYLEIETQIVSIQGEPTPSQIDDTVSTYKDFGTNVIIAIGGGSVIDAGKAIAAMLCEDSSIVDFLEGIGTKAPSGKKLPLIAIPTTSGTGSEATKNAVITQHGPEGFKKSLRHENYIPDIALIDPNLTLGCPPSVTAASGMDAFTQLLESYLSTNSSAMSDALAMDGLRCIVNSLQKAVQNGQDIQARTELSYAAMLSGLTLANAGLGAVHGFAQPLGSIHAVPHGVVCGTLMGVVNRLTVEKLKKTSNTGYLLKYANVARLVTDQKNQEQAIDDFLDFIDHLTITFELPLLRKFGIKEEDFDQIVAKTGLKYHPVEFTDEELKYILKQRL